MAAQFVRCNERRAGEASIQPRSLLRSKVSELSEAECGEVIEYIEVMRSLRREAADRRLFGDGFARRVSALCEGKGLPV
jgi:hypothetical protein